MRFDYPSPNFLLRSFLLQHNFPNLSDYEVCKTPILQDKHAFLPIKEYFSASKASLDDEAHATLTFLLERRIRSQFQKAGCDGKGTLNLLWVPPVLKGYETSSPLFYTEESNPPIAFLAYPKSLRESISTLETPPHPNVLTIPFPLENNSPRRGV